MPRHRDADAGLTLGSCAEAEARLAELRRSYEPYVLALSNRLIVRATSWRHATSVRHNWRTDPRGDGGAHL
jgi:hypothetical protein